MTYEDKKARKDVRHTVRVKPADDALLRVLAERLDLQPATLINRMALRAARKELQDLGMSLACVSLQEPASAAARG